MTGMETTLAAHCCQRRMELDPLEVAAASSADEAAATGQIVKAVAVGPKSMCASRNKGVAYSCAPKQEIQIRRGPCDR